VITTTTRTLPHTGAVPRSTARRPRPAPTRATILGTVALGVLAATLLAGCDAAPGPAEAASASAPPTPTAPDAQPFPAPSTPAPTPDTLEVSADAETATTLGTSGVVSAHWGDREGGDSLAVDATAWARHAGQAGVDVVWAELVAADAGVDTATMHDQLVCHALGAPDKDTWNLEPWRPDVGLVQVLAARCNPTG
jgi:hypothetical protein